MAQIKQLKADALFNVRTGLELYRAYQIDPLLPFKFGCCNGKCAVCLIKVIEGYHHLSKLTKQEKITLEAKKLASPPFRLACQCAILGDITIE